jgi:endonuclease/exonuclease/phosphatase family metal-dependent hydrolase
MPTAPVAPGPLLRGPIVGPVGPPDLHVMTFNIRRRMPHLLRRQQDWWEHRRPLVQQLLETERPSILGVQEALPDQAGFVRHALGETYRSIGYGRNANKRGEGCPMFYDRERLELIDWAQTALSDTPSIPGSTTWGNPTPRVVVAATFRDRSTGIRFRALNTHFDQFSRRSRMRSADEILRLVAQSPLPAFVTGDFNVDDQSEPHNRITSTGALVDSWQVSRDRLTEAWGSFPNYRDPVLERKRIDWILVSPSIEVVASAINTTRYQGRWPSDHAPVQAVLGFSRTQALPSKP